MGKLEVGAGDRTQTGDIQLGSSTLPFEIGVAENLVWSTRFAVSRSEFESRAIRVDTIRVEDAVTLTERPGTVGSSASSRPADRPPRRVRYPASLDTGTEAGECPPHRGANAARGGAGSGRRE